MCGRNWPKNDFHHDDLLGGEMVGERETEAPPSSNPRY